MANLDTGVITSYALYILVGLIFYILMAIFSYNRQQYNHHNDTCLASYCKKSIDTL